MIDHAHDLVPVVTDGELVASLCRICWEQKPARAWIERGDAIQDQHARDLRVEACRRRGTHTPEQIQLKQFGTSMIDTIDGRCAAC